MPSSTEVIVSATAGGTGVDGSSRAASRPGRSAATRSPRSPIGLLLLLSAPILLVGCAEVPRAAPPSASSAPYTPTPPKAVDLRSASQALSLQISARGVPVDGLDCSTDGSGQQSVVLRCTVTTGGAGHPDQIAEASWNRAAGTVHLRSVEPAPSTPQPPLASAPLDAADDADVPAARVTRAVRPALIAVGALTEADTVICSDLHAGLAGCEMHAEHTVKYWNVVLEDSTLRIYSAHV